MSTNIYNKKVLVIGLGLHGGAIGTILWLTEQGASITVTDKKTADQLAPSIEQLKHIPNITYIFGGHENIDASAYDIIIRNPAVPRNFELLENARKHNIPVEMDSSLFFEYCPSKNIIGITGSKGKTTTASAIAFVIKKLNEKTVAVGIDGVSPLAALLTPTPAKAPIIFELSSWRLEALQERHISPHIAVATSIYKDHLNTYKDFDEYIDVKKQIIKDQTKDDTAILNADDKVIRTWEADVRGNLFWYSLAPLEENQEGIWVDGGNICAHTPHPSPLPIRGEGNDGDNAIVICKTSDIPHTSQHQLRNTLPAILIGLLHGGASEDILQALQTMPVLKHRLQLVRTIDGVEYVNDSAATMPDAAIAALAAYKEKQIIVILGGSDKALEFEDFAQAISQANIKTLVWLPGTATDRMKEIILPHTHAQSFNAKNMQQAVEIASKHAASSDVVLLSPGATSFGLFLHEFDRGNAFISAVDFL